MSLLKRLGKKNEIDEIGQIFGKRNPNNNDDTYQQIKSEIHQRIVENLDGGQRILLEKAFTDKAEKTKLETVIAEYSQKVMEEHPFALPRADRNSLVSDVSDEIFGLGPIEPFLKDDTITEIMINGPKKIFIEKMGKLHLTKVYFQDNTHLMHIIERILTPLGRRVDESSPLVDARLADGSRVNIIVPPLALNGPCVTIRKFSRNPLTMENLVNFGTLDENMSFFLQACVKAKLNVLVSGGTGSGKTTTLNALSSFIPNNERIVTIEDAAELRLQQKHVVTLEARPENIEGKGAVTIRDLVRNALRMRPDRIIVGEVRSGEALDMLQAMNTGHDGSLTTAHANNPRDALRRLETMVLMAGVELPVRAIREQISSAIDLIMHQSRIRDGSRRITYISEVQGMEGDVIILQDIFRYVQTGIDENGRVEGRFTATGMQPGFLEKFQMNGIEMPLDIFDSDDIF
ncbi:CpaF family protein [Pectinatus brassicae]|uniref:Pilus assembly protein CpaF n=1 Tax=Pectinatus brassicae TaxID=862415 RepID=A0A840UBI8_9FIRM|nr:CpaF family protein [Pectinatus brassicae]MBB5335081.1 pilus assembly protein CpaF [Pectinatus brassicae]